MQLRTLIVEDDLMARRSMERLVNKNENLILVGVCENGQEGSSFLQDNEVDLILLDVEMPEMDGFSMLENLDKMPVIIMTTQKEKYAFEAFQYRVFDYLKKPVTTPVFDASINKLVVHLSRDVTTGSNKKSNNIFLKVDQRLIKVRFNDIYYIENLGDYVKVKTNESHLVVHSTMKSLVEKLPAEHFMRVHRTYIVNLDHINDIEQNSILIGGKMIPVSRNSKTELLSRLNTL